ncbi:hypothetical protein GCWU000324_01672 [Kingella oralis ATCC 51147]|uniref:Uncharacterized protein n=1 Tax=Kingella oralis ATCC 51147 TaxID=629741 RepID=C4GL16_9NEIS|nr:hypothetical protein GCWU000324_01672 [Kingella oralis ATCC 51147]
MFPIFRLPFFAKRMAFTKRVATPNPTASRINCSACFLTRGKPAAVCHCCRLTNIRSL